MTVWLHFLHQPIIQLLNHDQSGGEHLFDDDQNVTAINFNQVRNSFHTEDGLEEPLDHGNKPSILVELCH